MCLIRESIKKGDDIPEKVREQKHWYKIFSKDDSGFYGSFYQFYGSPRYPKGGKIHYTYGRLPNEIESLRSRSKVYSYTIGFHMYPTLELALANMNLPSPTGIGYETVVVLIEAEDILAWGQANISWGFEPDCGVFEHMTILEEVEYNMKQVAEAGRKHIKRASYKTS